MLMLQFTRIKRTQSSSIDLKPLARKAVMAIGALAFAGLAANAQAASYGSHNMAENQSPQAQQICETVMGLQSGDDRYESCVSSVADLEMNANRSQAVVRARNACFAQGLKAGSAELGDCLLQADDAKPAADAAMAPTTVNLMVADLPRFSADNAYPRERQACARLGFDPAFSAFSSCVASLQTVVHKDDIPEG
jgi:hypothetical protein